MQHESEAGLDALMGRLSAGDRSAFEPLFRALHPRAIRLARARLPAAGADDVAQTALLKVFANAHRFVASRPVLPWFYAIVSNEVRAARRRVRRTDPAHEPALHASEAASAEEVLLQRDLLRALEEAIADLDDDAASAIRCLLGESERPDVAPTTYRKRVSRAYARLRILLGELR